MCGLRLLAISFVALAGLAGSAAAHVTLEQEKAAANSTYNLLRVMGDGVGIGPILMGLAKSAHVLTPSATARRIVNMTAIAAVDALVRAQRAG